MNLLYEYIYKVDPAFTVANFELLTKDFRRRHFKKGDRIVCEGETQRNIYFVEKAYRCMILIHRVKPIFSALLIRQTSVL